MKQGVRKMKKYNNELVKKTLEDRKKIYESISENLADGILIYGAGFMGEHAYDYLVENGIRVKYFVDRNPNKIGSYFKGVEVIGPDDARIKEDSCMLITVRFFASDIEAQYRKEKLRILPFSAFHVIENWKEYADVRDHYMEDEVSKETFNALLYCMLTADATACEDVKISNQYFALTEFSGAVLNEIFVDLGAYVGDTIERFIWEHAAFRHIYAFEPGEKPYNAMKTRVKRLCEEWCIESEKISLVKAGVSNENYKMSMVSNSVLVGNTLSKDIDGEEIVDVYSLDSYLNGREVTFIKADVEGMEMQVLEGARETILKYKPKLAMSAYHYPCDLYRIAKYIKQLNPNYKFKLRLHMAELSEYVLYCY